MGVEMSIPVFAGGSPLQTLPEWIHKSMREGMDSEEEAAVPGDHTTLMPRAFCVAGILHVVDNLSKDLHDHLGCWQEYWRQLKAVETLLTSQHYLDRFIITCLAPAGHGDQEDMFKHISCPALYEKRWGVVVDFLSVLLPRQALLAATFSLGAFSAGLKDAKFASEMDAALSSPLFLSYGHMIMGVHQILGGLTSWLESCSCHHGMRKPSKRALKAKSIPCVMRGRCVVLQHKTPRDASTSIRAETN
eukprot:3101001-Amphidinium_carterae.1